MRVLVGPPEPLEACAGAMGLGPRAWPMVGTKRFSAKGHEARPSAISVVLGGKRAVCQRVLNMIGAGQREKSLQSTGARVTRVVLAEAIDPGARGARAAWRGRLDANTGTFGSGPRAAALVRERPGALRVSSEKTDGAGATTFAPWRARARRGAPPHRRRRWCARIRCARASASANDDRSSVLACSEGNGFEPSLAAWRGALRARCAQRLDSGDAIWPVGPWRPSGPSAQRPSAAWDNSATSSSSRSGAATTSASAPSERPPRVVEAHPASSATSKPAALSQGLRPAS